ncbi:MAG: hypothetical protein H6926_07245 [Chromatiales bacterium]|nr:hypothetical protein [Gammaproteobacteria bacterium]MCP5352966.1 hypothetical protein [Chromatiales bacterium]
MHTLRGSLLLILLLGLSPTGYAHHVLGRPAYALSEDSNTPPSMAIETQIGAYFVTMMAFPAFPQPGEAARVNLYARRIDDGAPFTGEVAFFVRDDAWLAAAEEAIGVQQVDDNVYRQGFVISAAGDYLVTARFTAHGEPYVIDFPVRVGDPAAVAPLAVAGGTLLALLIGVNVAQRRRIARRRAQLHPAHPEREV